MTCSQHVYEIRPRKDRRGVDLISDVLPFGRLWYAEPNAVSNAIGYAKFFSRSHDAVIRVYDDAGPFLSSLRRSKILVRRTPDIASLSFTHRLTFRLRSGDTFCDVVILGSQSGVSIPNSINCCLSTCLMLFLLSERKSFANQLMPLLWQNNGTKTEPRKIRSNYHLDDSSRARLFVCACRHGLVREEPRRGS